MNVTHGGSDTPVSPSEVCRRWFADAPVVIEPLPASGFSGAVVLKVHDMVGAGTFVLKSFHAGTSRERAAWVHRLSGHLRSQGIVAVPEVVPSHEGDTIEADASGTLWELCRFLPGVAVPRPDPGQMAAACEALARLHLAAARLPGAPPHEHASPGLLRRVEQARGLEAAPWVTRRAVWRRVSKPQRQSQAGFVVEVARRFDAAIDLWSACDGSRAIGRVARLQPVPLTVQPVLRDIWSDHVLYAGPDLAAVTGVVDLHAAGIDTPATDIARLLGSWGVSEECASLSPAERHPVAMEAYERIRPLSARERRLIGFLHATAVIFGLDNWFRWVLDERRQFSSTQRVLDRIDSLMQELRQAIARVADAGIDREGIVD